MPPGFSPCLYPQTFYSKSEIRTSAIHQLLYASLSLWLAQELLLIHLWINAWRAGTRARAPLRCELTGIVAPRVLHVLVPLLWDEHKPLLTRRLVVFRIRLPCPEERTGWENLFGAGAALVVDGQRWQLEELSLRWEELRGEKRYGGKQKLACRLVAMADAAGDDVIHEDEQLHERREAAAAAKAATAERRRALLRTRRRLQAVAMDIAEESSDEEAGIEDGERPDGHTRVSKLNVVETTALGSEARRRLLHAAGGQPATAPPRPTPRLELAPLDLALPPFTELSVYCETHHAEEAAEAGSEAATTGETAESGAAAARVDAVDRVRACGRDDLFGVLGLERGTHADEVRPAYLAISKAVHPDKNPGRMAEATEAQQIVGDAHLTLRCPRRRQAYMLCSSWHQYVAELELAEQETARRRGGEARERDARRAEKRKREEWGGRSAEEKKERSGRRHRREGGKRRART